MKISVRRLAFAAVTAAAYAALTMLTAFMSFGGIQLRLAEVLCILPYFFPGTAWGVFAGCFIANIISPLGPLDMIFGSLATLGACLCAAGAGRWEQKNKWGARIAACAMPVVWNSAVIGTVLAMASGDAEIFQKSFPIYALEIAGAETLVMFAVGLPLMAWLPGTRLYAVLKEKYGQ